MKLYPNNLFIGNCILTMFQNFIHCFYGTGKTLLLLRDYSNNIISNAGLFAVLRIYFGKEVIKANQMKRPWIGLIKPDSITLKEENFSDKK